MGTTSHTSKFFVSTTSWQGPSFTSTGGSGPPSAPAPAVSPPLGPAPPYQGRQGARRAVALLGGHVARGERRVPARQPSRALGAPPPTSGGRLDLKSRVGRRRQLRVERRRLCLLSAQATPGLCSPGRWWRKASR